MVVVSVVTAVIATMTGAAFDLPTWAFLAIYPMTGAVSLLLTAALWSIRDVGPAPERALVTLEPGANSR
jgi:hypothetical protein